MGCEGCARAVLLAFNLVLFLIGAAALGVGIWVLIDGTIFLQLLANIPNSGAYAGLIQDAAYIFIGAGAGIFIIAFLGCFGAWKRNKCLLITYSIIVGVLLLLEIACVVVAHLFYEQVSTTIKTELSLALGVTYNSTFTQAASPPDTYSYSSGDILSKGVDAIQLQFSCCGVNNYTDYGTNGLGAPLAPLTCCNTTTAAGDIDALVNDIWGGSGSITVADPGCIGNAAILDNVPGCYSAIENYVLEKRTIITAVMAATIGVQVFLIIFACCVACRSDKDD